MATAMPKTDIAVDKDGIASTPIAKYIIHFLTCVLDMSLEHATWDIVVVDRYATFKARAIP